MGARVKHISMSYYAHTGHAHLELVSNCEHGLTKYISRLIFLSNIGKLEILVSAKATTAHKSTDPIQPHLCLINLFSEPGQ